jgi:predicted AlkP superfamily pyrophosphatase or phosphodiesterase
MHLPRAAMLLAGVLAAAAPLLQAGAKDAAPPATAATAPPRLIVAISVDQFSADLFARYRRHFTQGLARLQDGAVFPSGYQSHAATETCPGHSTILTGVRPARSGIIANEWTDQSIARADKRIYCAEDETNPASAPDRPVVSARHLNARTLGDRLKARDPASRNVAVSYKDRTVVMMGGHTIDAGYWWRPGGFVSFEGVPVGPAAQAANRTANALIAKGAPAMAVPSWCAGMSRAVDAGGTSVGEGRFQLERGKAAGFTVSPRVDAAVANLAIALVDEQQLGRDTATDVLSVGLSATDTIGHTFGPGGLEMCIQMAELDKTVGRMLAALDARRLDYMVVLTADHGGFDVVERQRQQAYPRAVRGDSSLTAEELGKYAAQMTGISAPSGRLVYGDGMFGDRYISRQISAAERAKVSDVLVARLKSHPQVAAVFTARELAATPLPSGSPQDWSMKDRARASFDPQRSGDLVVLLDRGVMPIAAGSRGYVSTHGSPWDYDRRVPILFWRRGMTGFEQPAPIETVDIAPTLAALLRLDTTDGDFDGRCLDLDGGPGNSCEVLP